MTNPSTSPKPRVSVIVPVYRSERTLEDLVEKLGPVLMQIAAEYELLLVNDGSPDNSWAVIEELAAKHAWVRGICMMRNYGQHNALLCGMRSARYEICVTMDDDLQHPPEEIPKLLAKLTEGYDVAYGVPQQRMHSPLRNLLSWFTKWALSLATGVKAAREINAFRAFRTELRAASSTFHSPQLLFDVLLTWGSSKLVGVKVNYAERAEGKSNYNLIKLLNQAILVIVGFSTAPLRLATFMGLGATVFGILALFWVLGRYLMEGSSTPGFPFVASLVSIFSGLQLFVMGIIGEYLARIFQRTQDKPTYTVKTTTPQI
jgi:glycosyltransferase involved in cell wall biosynthesis